MEVFFLFKNTRTVIKAESLCRDHAIQVEVVPVPEKVSSECGMALKSASINHPIMSALFEQNNITFSTYEE
ncbi:MAG: putative Se/S carrier-like protein [Bacteroidales bacterium]